MSASNYLRNVATLRRIQIARDNSEPPEYWDNPMDKEEEEDMDIKLTAECADCEGELNVTTIVSDGRIKMLVRPCPHCVARKATVALSSDWGRKKIEREAGL